MNSRATIRRIVRRLERGEDESFEFTALITPVMIMLLLIAFAVLVRSSQMPAWSAAAECARAAIATRDETIGRAQGLNAAYDSLNGNFIKASAGAVNITGSWVANGSVTCSVYYDIDIRGIMFFSEMTGGKVPISASVTMQVEPYKSKWQ